MAELRTINGEVAVRNTGPLADARKAQEVWLWDCGPEKPKPPTRPETPSGKQGDPEYDLAVIEFKESLENYEEALKEYAAKKKEHAHWHKVIQGPVELVMWSVNARDALANDDRAVKEGRQEKLRYYISSRTRGWSQAKNHGLPIGVKPGKGHQAALEREIAGEKEFVQALRNDPQFGMEMQ